MDGVRLSPSVALANAKDFVRETQLLLDPWLTQAAHLRAQHGLGRDRDFQERARTLGKVVATELFEFDRRVEAAQPEIAEHSVVRDVRRSLVGLLESLRELEGPIG